jgi:hypothetical protein
MGICKISVLKIGPTQSGFGQISSAEIGLAQASIDEFSLL